MQQSKAKMEADKKIQEVFSGWIKMGQFNLVVCYNFLVFQFFALMPFDLV